jgi:hypothetical protein
MTKWDGVVRSVRDVMDGDSADSMQRGERDKDEHYQDADIIHAGYGGDPNKHCDSVEGMRLEAIDFAKRYMEAKGRIPPLVFAFMPLETPNVAMLMLDSWSGTDGKRRMGRNIADFAARHKAAALVMCTDGWGIVTPPKLRVEGNEDALRKWTDAQYERYGDLEHHPDRFEVLTINTIWPDGTCTGWVCQYKRLKTECEDCYGVGCNECRQQGSFDSIEWGELHDDWPVGDGDNEKKSRTQQFIVPPWSSGAPQ